MKVGDVLLVPFVVNASMKNLSRTDRMSGEKFLQRIQRAGPVPKSHVTRAWDKHQLGARSYFAQSFRRRSRRAAAALDAVIRAAKNQRRHLHFRRFADGVPS